MLRCVGNELLVDLPVIFQRVFIEKHVLILMIFTERVTDSHDKSLPAGLFVESRSGSIAQKHVLNKSINTSTY